EIYPVSIFFIVVNEFCERFSYYGMRAVLVLYFRFFFRWDDDLATSIYHAFVALCYLTPILGAIVADSWLGKFKTIIYLSIVYAIGQIVMAVSAINDLTDADRDGTPDNMSVHVGLAMLGLFLIALGTGGIKPCVSAFGGDQFDDHQLYTMSLKHVLIPTSGQECGIHTQQKCYPLAFGVPAALMVVSLIVFIAGSGMYIKAKPKGNIMMDVCNCIGFAINNRFRHRSSKYPKREHWLDWADEKYDKLLIAQIKMVCRVLFLYIPLPMFWTLFDQKGSRWTLQATTMDGTFGSLVLQPDQMQTVNPILILTLVPIMDRVVYPLIKKCGFNFTPLKRMTVGMFLAAMAFVSAALVQIQIDVSGKYITSKPEQGSNAVRFVNGLSSEVNMSYAGNDKQFPALEYVYLPQGERIFTITNGIQSCSFSRKFGFGGAYTFLIPSTLLLTENVRIHCGNAIVEVEDIKPNTVHMALQIPQYFLITAGEVVFSVTGLEFSYSQAPSNMKAVLQAGWLFTVAVGNFIVLIVAELAKLPQQWAEYVLFASLLVAVCIIFSIMAYFYTYVDPAEIEAQFTRKDEMEPEEKEKNTIELEEKDFKQDQKEKLGKTKM
uniref:Solute carrier family 15 member 1 n=1 Tax=Astyanax mexicanus TaxID=7994 RepID=A0A8B9R7A7_ASTMX